MHLALGLGSVNVRRMMVADAEPSYATFSPTELRPFVIRCDFRCVQDDEGELHIWLVGGPALQEPKDFKGLERITPAHARTLEENRWRYSEIAEGIYDLNHRKVERVRTAMLEKARDRRKGEPLSELYLLDLANEYRRRRGERGLLYELADSRGGVGRIELGRQLKKAEALGFIPEGLPHRPSPKKRVAITR